VLVVVLASAVWAVSAGAQSRRVEKPKLGMTPGTRVLSPLPGPKDTNAASVAISRNGTTLVVGQPGNFQDRALTGTTPGTAYVFVRASRSSRWQQKAVLAAPGGKVAGNGFGQAVAVSPTGNEIAVGAPGTSIGGHTNTGAVYVFTRSAGGWSSKSPVASLTPSDPADSKGIGDAVGISTSTVVAGNGHGQPVYVFERRTRAWANATQKAELSAPQPPARCSKNPFNTFGSAVAVDGQTVAVGFNTYPSARSCQPSGAVFMFERPAAGWANTSTPTATLQSKDGGTNDELGTSLALQGGTLVAGAPNTTVAGFPAVGAVYVFERPQSGWGSATETARLAPPVPFAGDLLGGTVGISGNTIVASNSICPNGPANCPFVFSKSAGRWRKQSRELVPPVSSQHAGGTPPLAAGGGIAIDVSEIGRLPVVVFDLARAGTT